MENEEALRILKHGIKVKAVKIDGLRKVKEDVVIPHLKPLFEPKNIISLLGLINRTFDKLDALDAFDNIDVKVEHIGKVRGVHEVGLRVAVSEARRSTYGMNVSSDQALNDGNFTMYAKIRNLFGRLESLRVDYVKGTKIADGCNMIFNKPILSQQNSNVKVVLSKENSLNRTAGFSTSDMKSNIIYQLRMLGGSNDFELGTLWQQIHGGNVPIKIREEFGHHLKCALRHKYIRDTRDDNLVATSGSRHVLETELAGFMGDVNHLKVNLESQLNAHLLLGYSATLSLRGGLIHELSENRRTWVTDKFFCGGPGSVRGFYADGIGRPLGGTCHWGAGLSLTRKLPFSPHIWGLGQFMRIHHFVNAGNLANDTRDLLKDPRVSVGSGIIIKVGGAMKMEINYAVPLRHGPDDIVNHGLQFGIGISFM